MAAKRKQKMDMTSKLKKIDVASWKNSDADAMILPAYTDSLPSLTASIDRAQKGAISRILKREAKNGETPFVFPYEPDPGKGIRYLIAVIGKKKEATRDQIRAAYGLSGKWAIGARVESVLLGIPSDSKFVDDLDAAIEGFVLGHYRFEKYLSKEEDKAVLSKVGLALEDSKTKLRVEKVMHRSHLYAQATNLARDWVNDTANVVNPDFLEGVAEAIGQAPHMTVKVIHEAELRRREMNLIVSVGNGSKVRPRMAHIQYRPKGKAKKTIALVGKGVTFDSGGYSLKPQGFMYGMKSDMGGAAAVLGAMTALSDLEPNVHVHGIVPLVENLVDGQATKPGDVVVGMNGKSVEIENTDAEGRLVLADALCYAATLNPDITIDAATLTGACVVALGDDISAVFTEDESFLKKFLSCAEKAGEKFWNLPLEMPYKKLLKSDVADMKNVGSRSGGAITAALFLSEFAPTKGVWAHLDIAGPAFLEKEWPICGKGGTGFGVRTFLDLILSYS